MKCQQLCNTSKPCYTEWCSPRDQGLGLMVPQGQKIKVLVLTLKSWGLSLELLVSVLVFMRNWTLSRLFKTFEVCCDQSTNNLNVKYSSCTRNRLEVQDFTQMQKQVLIFSTRLLRQWAWQTVVPHETTVYHAEATVRNNHALDADQPQSRVFSAMEAVRPHRAKISDELLSVLS